jgi:hypothetical protein
LKRKKSGRQPIERRERREEDNSDHDPATRQRDKRETRHIE